MSKAGSKGGYRPNDTDLWERVAETVPHRNPRRGDHIDFPFADDLADAPPKPQKTTQPKSKSPAPAPKITEVSPPKKPPLPELSIDRQPGMDRRTQQLLRRGKVEIEGRLDLHGMTQTEAHGALIRFVAASQQFGKRCVLVITGKGLGPDGSIGVLRSQTPRWLNEPGIRERVIGFRQAARQHGGEGALYVLLKKRL